MTTRKTTKRALLLSCLSLLLCLSMLVGSTFAWFTDTATTGVNTIVAGNLDIKLSYKNAAPAAAYKEVTASANDLFVSEKGKEILWEPGAVSICYFKLENLGSLDLKYKMAVNYANTVTYTPAGGTEVKLSDALKSAIVELTEGQTLSQTEALAAAEAGAKVALGYKDTTAVTMNAGAPAKYFAIVIAMPTSVGNTYNVPAGVPALKVELGVSLVAGQLDSEFDSFGNQYDQEALLPEFVQEQFTPNVNTVLTGNNIKATIPANSELKDESNNPISANTNLVLSIEPASKNNNITVTEGAAVETYEISLKTADGKKVTSSAPITVELNVGKNRTGVIALYHHDALVSGTSYNAGTGILTFTTNDFSPYSVVETFAAKIGNTLYGTLEAAITAASEGDTITVLANSVEFPAINKNKLTFKTSVGTKVTKMANTSAVGVGTTFDGFEFTGTGPCVAKDLTVKNCKFTGYDGIYYGSCSGELLIENCVFNNKRYGLQIGEGSGVVNVKNTTFVGGFNTFGSGFELTFTGCRFTTENASGSYAVFQTHGKMTIRDSVFEASWPKDLNEDGTDNGVTYVGNAKSYAVTEIYNTTYEGGNIFELTSATDGGIFVLNPEKNGEGLYTAGNFLIEPEAERLAAGCTATENSDGTYTVKQLYSIEGNTITVMDPAFLNAALDAAKASGEAMTVKLPAGEYAMPAIYQNWGALEISIIGAANEDGTPATVINVTENTLWGLKGTIQNILFKDPTNSKIVKLMDGNSLHADVLIDNCVFDGASIQFTGVATIQNSVFKGNGAAWSGIQYSAPTGDILIDNCEFSGYCFTNLQVTDEGAHKDLTVTVKNCKIGALSENAVDYAEGVTLYVDTIVLENNTIDCDVWTPTFAEVTKTDNATSANGEVSYKNW